MPGSPRTPSWRQPRHPTRPEGSPNDHNDLHDVLNIDDDSDVDNHDNLSNLVNDVHHGARNVGEQHILRWRNERSGTRIDRAATYTPMLILVGLLSLAIGIVGRRLRALRSRNE